MLRCSQDRSGKGIPGGGNFVFGEEGWERVWRVGHRGQGGRDHSGARALRGGGSLSPNKGFVLTLCMLGAFLRFKLWTMTSTAEDMWITCASCRFLRSAEISRSATLRWESVPRVGLGQSLRQMCQASRSFIMCSLRRRQGLPWNHGPWAAEAICMTEKEISKFSCFKS